MIFMYPTTQLEIYKEEIISHGEQIKQATNLVREFVIPLRTDGTGKWNKISLGVLNNKTFEQTEFGFNRNCTLFCEFR